MRMTHSYPDGSESLWTKCPIDARLAELHLSHDLWHGRPGLSQRFYLLDNVIHELGLPAKPNPALSRAMTGSFVIAGMQFFRSEVGALAKLLAIPSFFLAGVAVTVLVHPLRERPRAALARSLGIECLLLLGFLAACLVGMPFHGPDALGAIVALLFAMGAMGAQSALVRC